MIFVSIALLVAAAVSLGIGIASSSVPPLVISVLATLAAGATLWGSFVHYRKAAAAQGAPVSGLGGNQPLEPGYPGAYTVPGTAAGMTTPAPVAVPARPQPVPVGWDELPDGEARDSVEAFALEELHELRRHEVEHARRPEVLAAIDERIDHLVSVRRKLGVS